MLGLKDKRGVMSISVVVLVVATLLLVVSALFIFNIRQKERLDELHAYIDLDEAYEKSILIDFYLSEIMDEIGENATSEEFNLELDKYQNSSGHYPIPELSQAEDMNFEIKFVGGNEFYNFVYSYEFDYEQ